MNQEVSKYDNRLYATRHPSGQVRVYREADKFDAADAIDEPSARIKPNPQIIFCVTNDWSMDGQPVEWGLEPIRQKLTQMDSWVRHKMFEEMVKLREMKQEDKKRMRTNEFRAHAADIRKDFARAFNDVNTSNLSKGDH